MNSFDYATASSASEAVAALAETPQTTILAGGTDLLTLMKAGLAAPPRLLDIKPARELRTLRFEADGSLRIGALATLAD
ncbi:MAG: FAD binding domain-containing protein, partial [Ktedonobacterales bacterium]